MTVTVEMLDVSVHDRVRRDAVEVDEWTVELLGE
jgi:hypothetical protein